LRFEILDCGLRRKKGRSEEEQRRRAEIRKLGGLALGVRRAEEQKRSYPDGFCPGGTDDNSPVIDRWERKGRELQIADCAISEKKNCELQIAEGFCPRNTRMKHQSSTSGMSEYKTDAGLMSVCTLTHQSFFQTPSSTIKFAGQSSVHRMMIML
jgi:hypothetical protein